MASFFLQFEKTLEDHNIPSRKWLQALQASLDGSLVDVYWDTFHQEERDTYEISKCTLIKSFQESINHVKTLSNGDSAEQVRFEWAKARTLAKVTRECAEVVWAKKPTTAAELVVAVVDWESIHGKASKLWSDHHKYYYRQQHQSQQQQQFDHNDQIKSPQEAERIDQNKLQQHTGQQH